ncbi:MAG: flagellar basal body L-ring protein FlgH [Opitutales bacterium]|nr:flagellar basal body L-ring protein FlgH [Opitutales bacterium]
MIFTKINSRNALFAVIAMVSLGGALNAESLWLKGNTERSMYSSKIAYRVGDILTVAVSEVIDFNSTQSIDTGSKDSALVDLAGVLFDSIDWDRLDGQTVAFSDILKGEYQTTPSAVSDSMNIVSAQIPVAVIDVLPNHNLVVEGMRQINFSGESRHIVFQGIVRPLDIDVTTNTVSSNRVANAQIQFVSRGAVGDVQRKGWFTRFVDKINPF